MYFIGLKFQIPGINRGTTNMEENVDIQLEISDFRIRKEGSEESCVRKEEFIAETPVSIAKTANNIIGAESSQLMSAFLRSKRKLSDLVV